MDERKENEETITGTCSLNHKKVSIKHKRIEVSNRPGDPTFLRMDSWYCDNAETCSNADCLGKVRDGLIKYWEINA